jgi:membrane-associated phospholipid phosphatase
VNSLDALRDTFRMAGVATRTTEACLNRQQAIMPGTLAWNGAALMLALSVLAILARENFPLAGFQALNGLATHVPDWLLANLTELGNTAVLAAVAALLGRRHPQFLLAFVMAALLGAPVINSLKGLFAVARPPAVLPAESFHLVGEAYVRGSFPSGHTFATFASAAVAIAFVSGPLTRAALLFGAATIGGSRVLIGVHWPVDVCAGAAGGLLLGSLCVLFTRHTRVGYHPAVHLVMIWLAVISNLVLIDSGSNYSQAAPMARAIALVSTLGIAWQYLVSGRRERRHLLQG